MNKFLEMLNPPDGQPGLNQVRANVGRIVNPDNPLAGKISEALIEIANSEIRGSGWHEDYAVIADRRFYGLIVKHQIWAALYTDNRHREIIRQLQNIMILAIDLIENDKLKAIELDPLQKIPEHDIAGLGSLIRKIAKKPDDYKEISLINNLLDLLEGREHQRHDFYMLMRFIKILDGVNVSRHHKKELEKSNRVGNGRDGIKKYFFGTRIQLTPDDPDDLNALPAIHEILPNDEHRKTNLYIDPAEEDLGGQVLIYREKLKALSVEFKIGHRKTEASRAILARYNSAPPITNRQLTDTELIKLWRYIQRTKNHESHMANKRVGMILEVMLLTSSSYENAISMLTEEQDSPIKFVQSKNEFRIDRIRPEYRTNSLGVRNRITDNLLQLRDYVSIPNYCNLNNFKEIFGGVDKLELKKNVKEIILILGDRITLSKISRQVFEIARSSYDPVIVQTTFGIRVSSATVQMFYTAVSGKQVSDCYTESANEFLRRVGADCVNHQRYDPGYYSPRNTPEIDDFKNIFNSIHQQIVLSNENFYRLHNLNTLLCVLCQSVFTTIRGIYDPMVEVDDYKCAVFYRDKDRQDFSNSRFQFVHPMAIRISEYYLSVRKNSIDTLNLDEIDTFTFLVSDDGRLITPRPQNIQKFLDEFTQYPINSIRKLIRTQFVERCVSYDSINMIMNHNSQGEAVWDKYSTVSPIDIHNELKIEFDKLIEDLGIQEDWFNAV